MVHELQLSDEAGKQKRNSAPDSAEGQVPQSRLCLWDNNHLTAQSQVIASQATDS